MKRYVLSIILIVVGLAGGSGCGGGGGSSALDDHPPAAPGTGVVSTPLPSPIPTPAAGSGVASIRVTSSGSATPTLSTGATQQVTVQALDAANNAVTNATYVWTSSDSAIVEVSSTGLVTAKAPGGPVEISVTSGTVTQKVLTVTVSCKGIASNIPTPMTVTFNPPSPISVEATTSVSATILDCNGDPVPDNTSVSFSMSPTNLATLSASVVPTTGGVANIALTAGANAGTVTVSAQSGTAVGSASLALLALPAGSIKFESAAPQIIGVKGAGQNEVSTVSFSVNNTQGNPVADGSTTVKLQFLAGQNPGGATIEPASVSTVGGIAKTFLKSGSVAGPVRILAFLDTDNDDILDAGEVSSTSTALSIGGGVPSMKHFSVSADVHNLAGLAYDGMTATLIVRLADRFSNTNVLQGTSVSFYTEAGAIPAQGVTNAAGETSVVLRTQNPRPIDTNPRQMLNPIGSEVFLYYNASCDDYDMPEPYVDTNGNGSYDTSEPYTDTDGDGVYHTGEPYEDADGDGIHDLCEHFLDVDGNGYDLMEPNPRDGYVSVVAVTKGEETFYDANGNGLYDSGERFDDNGGEPFVDENDDAMYTVAETFDDLDGNGSYTRGEVFYDQGRGEPFYDRNGNSFYDTGEPFTDLDGDLIYDPPGDAFYDANQNTVHDAGELTKETNSSPNFQSSGFHDWVYNKGEFYVDTDQNGKWTHGNGIWDANTDIWVPNTGGTVSQRFVFTGRPHFSPETSRIVIESAQSGYGYAIPDGGCGNFRYYVADVNNNALIPGTTIAVKADGGKLIGQADITLPDDDGGGPTWDRVSLCDSDPGDTNPPVLSTLTITITWQPPGAAKLEVPMGVTGTID